MNWIYKNRICPINCFLHLTNRNVTPKSRKFWKSTLNETGNCKQMNMMGKSLRFITKNIGTNYGYLHIFLIIKHLCIYQIGNNISTFFIIIILFTIYFNLFKKQK